MMEERRTLLSGLCEKDLKRGIKITFVRHQSLSKRNRVSSHSLKQIIFTSSAAD